MNCVWWRSGNTNDTKSIRTTAEVKTPRPMLGGPNALQFAQKRIVQEITSLC